jgi:hypothetical protein
VPSPIVTSATFAISRARTFHLTPTPVQSDLLSLFSLGSAAAKRLFRDYRIDDEHSEVFLDPEDHLKVYPQPGLGSKGFSRSGQSGKPLGNLNIADPRDYEINKLNLPIGVCVYNL